MNLEQLALELEELALTDLDNSIFLEYLSLEKGKPIFDKIKEQDAYSFLCFILSTFGSFNLGYMLVYIPFIWEDIKISDIKKILAELSDKGRYDGIVAMMSFLSRYIGIDPIQVYENTHLTNNEEIRDVIILNREAFTSSVLTIKLIDYKIKEKFKSYLSPLEDVKARFLSEGAIEFQEPVFKKKSFLEKLQRLFHF